MIVLLYEVVFVISIFIVLYRNMFCQVVVSRPPSSIVEVVVVLRGDLSGSPAYIPTLHTIFSTYSPAGDIIID
jgi:hypothetical protein